MERGFLEKCLAQGMSLEAIGKQAGKHPSTVGYWLKKHGLSAVGRDRFSPRGGLKRDTLEAAVADGLTLREIADAVNRDISTVRYWLRRYGIQIANQRRRRHGNGARFAIFHCGRHGQTEFVLEGSGYYRCKRCRSEGVAKRRRAVKQQLVAEAGGACVVCGYARWFGALQFHHVEAKSKEFHLAQGGYSRSIARSRAEMKKCVLLCANCHAEVESGFATLPVHSSGSPHCD